MKRINLRGLSEVLSERELKNVFGGSQPDSDCNEMKIGDDCWKGGRKGCCAAAPFAGIICKVPC